MTSPSFLRLAAVAALVLGLAGCGKSESYKYKLTLVVDTPAGVKRGSSVAEVMFYAVSINDPNSVIEVDPNDPQATLGPGITPSTTVRATTA